MKLSVSQIAWKPADNIKVASLLQSLGLKSIDVTPNSITSDVGKKAMQDAERIRRWWEEKGIRVSGMQSLFFGTSGLSIFGSSEVQKQTLNHLKHLCGLAKALGCQAMTFGSPKQRDPLGRKKNEAWSEAKDFFKRAGDIAWHDDTFICIEANPKTYGCNFLTETEEAANMVYSVDHPGIRLQIDTGTCIENREDLESILSRHKSIVGHVHLSDPGLAPFSTFTNDHRLFSDAMEKHLPEKTCTVEMLTHGAEDPHHTLQISLKESLKVYLNQVNQEFPNG